MTGRLGLPVERAAQAPVPFPVTAALRFTDQAQFHPGLYLAGMAAAFVDRGGVLIEGTRVDGVSERGATCRVRTRNGEVHGDRVVLATHHPILDRGGHIARLRARRSYGVPGVLPPDVPAGMTINVGSPTHSTRTAHLDGEHLLIVVGEGHPVGRGHDAGRRWDRLRVWAREAYGVRDFRYHWSGQEIGTADGMPFVGRLHPLSSRLFTATGFDGWGMTNGTAAALIIRDLITEVANPWATHFDASRAWTQLPGLETLTQRSWDCPCHGSRFDPDGAVLQAPATKPLRRLPVSETDTDAG